MKELCKDLAKLIEKFTPNEGPQTTAIKGVHCLKYLTSDKRSKRHWRACFGIIAQGSKEVILDEELYKGREGNYTVSPIDLPVISRIANATPEKPFLGVLIDFDPHLLNEIDSQLPEEDLNEYDAIDGAIFLGKADEKMLAAVIRLMKVLELPEDAPILGPLIVKEIFYYLLKGPNGNAIRQFVRSGSKMHKISKAIHKIKTELQKEISVPDLAKSTNMSRSAFFKAFKEATSMSPIQYQKRFRLLEARRMMMSEGETAERAAFKVGYNSSSQFNREYSRMFGNSPLRDVVQIKQSGNIIRPI